MGRGASRLQGLADGVAVRDTTDRDNVTREFTAAAWQEFTRRLRG